MKPGLENVCPYYWWCKGPLTPKGKCYQDNAIRTGRKTLEEAKRIPGKLCPGVDSDAFHSESGGRNS